MATRKTTSRELATSFRRVETKARPIQAALESWLMRFARTEAFREAKIIQDGGISKAVTTPSNIDAQLARIIEQFGLAQVQSGANRAGRMAREGRRVIIPSQAVDRYLRDAEVRIVGILDKTRDDVRAAVRRIIQDANQESPRPSAGEIARRIRTQFHGKAGAGGRVTGVVEERDRGILPTTRIRTSAKDGILYAFSSERAALIARTEMQIAENTGIAEGYQTIGVKRIMWLAFKFPKWPRKHDEMHRVVRSVSNGIMDRDTWFRLPDGTRCPYPGWDGLPIRHLAHCRCTTRPMRG